MNERLITAIALVGALGCGHTGRPDNGSQPDASASDDATPGGDANDCPGCGHGSATTTAAGLYGTDVRLHYAPDGTAYLLVIARDADHPAPQLSLYSQPPGGAITSTGWQIDVDGENNEFDFAIRSDGTLMIAYQPYELSQVRFVTWKDGVASTPAMVGTTDGASGVSTAIDPAGTLWMTWAPGTADAIAAYSIDTGGTRRSYSLSADTTVEWSSVAYDPALGEMFAAYSSVFTGTYFGGSLDLSGTAALANPCPAESMAFDSGGHEWAIYNTYEPTNTYACRDGQSEIASDPRFTGSTTTSVFETRRLALDSRDTAYVATYWADSYTASWYASSDGATWTSGALPTHFGLATEQDQPAAAAIALATDPAGRVSIAVIPQYASMGDAVLHTFAN